MKVSVIIPAAGMGSRMASPVSKQFLALGGRPILAHTLAIFEKHPAIDQVFIVAPRAEIDHCLSEVVQPFGFAKVRQVVPGGAERQDSVRLGLQACGAADDDLVLIHDGVRPFFPAGLVDEVIGTARESGACIVAVPVKDTIKLVEGGQVRQTPVRKSLWQAQTPQAFRFELIRRAHEQAHAAGFLGTDDASLVERLGHPVRVVRGSYRNIKITTPEDLVLGESFLREEGWQG